MTTKIKLVTAEEFWDMTTNDSWHELVRGEVCEVTPAGGPHSQMQLRLGGHFERFSDRTGGAAGTELGFILQRKPDTVRAPDIYYMRPGRAIEVDNEGFCSGVPDIAVEILSPGDTAVYVNEKVEEYLAAGTLAVWVVNQRRQTIRVDLADGTYRVYHAGDTIDGGSLFPGLSVPLDQVFRRRRAQPERL